jgi:hypothetical protein
MLAESRFPTVFSTVPVDSVTVLALKRGKVRNPLRQANLPARRKRPSSDSGMVASTTQWLPE